MTETRIEFTTRMIPLNDQYDAEIQKMREEGWVLVPGPPPVAIFQLQRGVAASPLQQVGMTSRSGFSIDDSKITIIRGGKPVE